MAGGTAYADVFAVDPGPGDTVMVSDAAGDVGSLTVPPCGASVIGLASERNHAWLRERGVVPVVYGDGYVRLMVKLGVRPERINTIRDWQAATKIGVDPR